MNHDIRNTCGKRRGCSLLITLPYDSQLKPIYSRVYGTRNDIQKILSPPYMHLDEELEKKRQMEKMVA